MTRQGSLCHSTAHTPSTFVSILAVPGSVAIYRNATLTLIPYWLTGLSIYPIFSNLNVSLDLILGNIEILVKQNSLFPSGPVIKCLLLCMLIMAIDDDNAGTFHLFEMWIGNNEFDHCILDHHMCGKNCDQHVYFEFLYSEQKAQHTKPSLSFCV